MFFDNYFGIEADDNSVHLAILKKTWDPNLTKCFWL